MKWPLLHPHHYIPHTYTVFTHIHIFMFFVFNGEIQSISITVSQFKPAPLYKLSRWSNRLTAASEWIVQKNTKRYRIRVEFQVPLWVLWIQMDVLHSAENFVVVEHTWNMDESHKLPEIFCSRVAPSLPCLVHRRMHACWYCMINNSTNQSPSCITLSEPSTCDIQARSVS